MSIADAIKQAFKNFAVWNAESIRFKVMQVYAMTSDDGAVSNITSNLTGKPVSIEVRKVDGEVQDIIGLQVGGQNKLAFIVKEGENTVFVLESGVVITPQDD